MKRRSVLLTVGLGLLCSASPGSAQLWFFPDYPVPSAGDSPASFLAATYGRGLNDASGKVDAIGLVGGVTGPQVSFMAGIGRTNEEGDDETTLGGAIGVDVVQGASATVSVQGGVGWFSFEFFGETFTALRFPIGVAVKGSIESESASVTPWVMPRLNVTRLSGGGDSDSQTDLGASGGLSVTFQSGFGIHSALDVLFGEEDELVTFGVGIHYVIPRGGS